MKITWTKPLRQQIHEVLLEAGYHFFIDPNTKHGSYVLRVGRQYYPRYHAYIKTSADGHVIDLHIDQKQVSYEGQNKHSGEYDGAVVQEEIDRIGRWLEHYSS
jgi:hypothetical protein